MPRQPKLDKDILLAEYSEAGDAMRSHADTRWKLLGVVIPISGGILALAQQFPDLKLTMNLLVYLQLVYLLLLNIEHN